MNVINVMNFVRQCEPRDLNTEKKLFPTTKSQLDVVNKYGVPNTFLLQYDAMCDPKYVDLFKQNATEKTELGLWFEIVKPMTDACGLPYRSENGWTWDWHIIPGFSMGYSPKERELLVDESMRKFKEIFGYYPKTIASWAFDTYTLNYFFKNYDISAVGICRDQVNTDAYTFRGGYFNQGYYPSDLNHFTPAQTDEHRVNVPIFRLLGPCPIHNYDDRKYLPAEYIPMHICFTMESVWKTGYTPETVDWFYKSYFKNENLGFGYTQIGQENSFGYEDLATPLAMQIEKGLQLENVEFLTMGETGERFKKQFPNKTPATAVVATEDWETRNDIQSTYYDCQNYTVNFFRYNRQFIIRSWYLFDERIKDRYMDVSCDTFDAVFDNLPIVDTIDNKELENIGLLIDDNTAQFVTEKDGENGLAITYNDKTIKIDEIGITFEGEQKLMLFAGKFTEIVSVIEGELCFKHDDVTYKLVVKNGTITEENGNYRIAGTDMRFVPVREGETA